MSSYKPVEQSVVANKPTIQSRTSSNLSHLGELLSCLIDIQSNLIGPIPTAPSDKKQSISCLADAQVRISELLTECLNIGMSVRNELSHKE